MSKRVRITVSVLILAALLLLLADPRETWRTLQGVDGRWAALAVLIMVGDRVLMSFKWLLLLGARGYRLTLVEGTALYCSAMLWGMALPTTVGADAVRTLSLRNRGVRPSDAVSSIIVERGIGSLCALALALVGLLALRPLWPGNVAFWHWFAAGGALLAAGVLFFVMSFSDRAFGALMRFVPSRWRALKVMQGMHSLHEAYRSLGTRGSLIVVFTLLTFAEQLLAVPFNWAVAHALGLDVPVIVLIGALPVALLVSRLPISFEGIGIFEGIFVVIMSQAGLAPAQSLAMAIVSRVLVAAALLPWWLVHGMRSGSLRPRVS